MALSSYRLNKLNLLVERDGKNCRYCKRLTHVRIMGGNGDHKGDDATLDHVIPRSQGGSDGLANLVLACWECNNSRGDRSFEDFCAHPVRFGNKPNARRGRRKYSAMLPGEAILSFSRTASEISAYKRSLQRINPVPIEETYRILQQERKPKLLKWSMAAAIERGEIDEVGMVRRAPFDM